ncbi:MAG TPA: (2Fe-2S)-binding protein [Terracidiphilus sp.]|jgi:sarcosine oxidase subunit alpha
MSEVCRITVNGKEVRVPLGTSVAAAMMMAGEPCRLSASGEPRGPLCGMGICMECRATVNGVAHQRTCQMTCADDMEVVTE